jgi:hypothetical protein
MQQSRPSRDEVPERIKRKIDIRKCLISIIWSVNGVHSLLDVPKDIAYNSTFFCDSVGSDFVESICTYSRRKTLKEIIVHLEDARRVWHPASSPDLAPNNFFLFGYVKSKLPDLAIRSREDLICEIRLIFDEILKVTLIPAMVHE